MSDGQETALQAHGHVGWLLGLGFALLAYPVWHILQLPAPVYLPELGRWATEIPDGQIGMRYYGCLGVGLAAFVLGVGLGRIGVVARVLGRGPGARWLGRLVVLEALAGLAYLAVAELSHWIGRA